MEETVKQNEQVSLKRERNSAFEILRIIAIIFVIASHFTYSGGFNFAELESTPLILANRYWTDFLLALGKAGVNLFVLISAFFLVDNTRFRCKKILTILLEMLTFSIVLGVIFFFVNGKSFSTTWLINMLFPFGSSAAWFMTSYLLMYIFSPLFNLGIKAMNKKMHLIFIIVLLVIWSFMPTFLSLNYGVSSFGWFLTLYLIASYIRLYGISLKVKPIFGILIACGTFIVVFFIQRTMIYNCKNPNYFVDRIMYLLATKNENSFTQVICTIVLFLSFKDIKMKNIKSINLIASTTMAIYLFHQQRDMDELIWVKIFRNSTYATSPYLIPYSLFASLVVFIAGVIVGLFYRYTFAIGYNKLLNKFEEKCLYKIDNLFNNKQ